MFLRSLLLMAAFGFFAVSVTAGDWPQWRGPNRDNHVVGFTAPTAWPKELKRHWKVEVGDGLASPALVSDKIFVFTRQGKEEVTRCLDAATGNEVWKDKYEAVEITGFAGGRGRTSSRGRGVRHPWATAMCARSASAASCRA